jgi:hypothetical protein
MKRTLSPSNRIPEIDDTPQDRMRQQFDKQVKLITDRKTKYANPG